MATNEEILPDLASIVEEVAGVDAAEVTSEKSFVDDLDIDSLSMVEIAVQAEDKFGVKIPDDELAKLTTGPGRRRLHLLALVSATGQGVVVTGMGATTPLGGDVATTWDGLLAGRSGVSTHRARTGSTRSSCR